MSNQINNIESEEKQLVGQLKHWLETEAKFYGRTDEDFLLMFVRGCKHDLEKSKKKLHIYYQNRKKVPQWWANRDLMEVKHLFQMKAVTALPDNYPQLPTIEILQFSKVPTASELWNVLIKGLGIYVEVAIRRSNCKANGFIFIADFTHCPFWVFQKACLPIQVYNFIHGFTTAMPVRLKQVHFFNFPLIGRAAWRLISALLPPKMRNRFFLYGSDVTALKDNIDIRLLPEEYGGTNGRLVDHEEAFLEEVFSYSDYFLDDNKYGFQ